MCQLIAVILVLWKETPFYVLQANRAKWKEMTSKIIKFTDIVPIFDGTGDVEDWITKFELVCKLQDVESQAATILPMMLTGSALSTYMEMGAKEKLDADFITRRLRRVFGMDPFVAYERLTQMRWGGEAIDVYLNKIRCLARTAGIKDDVIVKRAFVTTLPPIISKDLRSLPDIETLGVEDLVTRARALSACSTTSSFASVAIREPSKEKPQIRCYGCGQLGHLKRNCPQSSGRRITKCWRCGTPGHISRDCNHTGNGEGGAAGPAPASPIL